MIASIRNVLFGSVTKVCSDDGRQPNRDYPWGFLVL
jgi:hypothetical protein